MYHLGRTSLETRVLSLKRLFFQLHSTSLTHNIPILSGWKVAQIIPLSQLIESLDLLKYTLDIGLIWENHDDLDLLSELNAFLLLPLHS
jgi:hypothetical protein